MVSNTSEFAQHTYTYNNRGLVDRWNVSYLNGYLKMEYNKEGRLVKSRYYSGGALVNTIVFFYENNRVVKETWYAGDTKQKEDKIFYSYNKNGMVWKSRSFIGDYGSIYKYTPDGGSVNEWYFYVGGKLNYEQHYTYLKKILLTTKTEIIPRFSLIRILTRL